MLQFITRSWGKRPHKLLPQKVPRSPSVYGFKDGEHFVQETFQGGMVSLSYGHPQLTKGLKYDRR